MTALQEQPLCQRWSEMCVRVRVCVWAQVL